jgi:nucleoside-diphosphate-sugar epimerase
MAIFIFAKALIEGQPIKRFNSGRMRRDFIYADDAVEAVERLIAKPPTTAQRKSRHRAIREGATRRGDFTMPATIVRSEFRI